MAAALAAPLLLWVALLVWPRPIPWPAVRGPVTSGGGPVGGEPLPPVDRTERLLQLIEAVAAQVRGGAAPNVAWDAAVEVLGHRARLAGSASLLEALRRLGAGERAAMSVAAAWTLAERVGAPLADLLDRLGTSLRQEADVEAQVQAALAAPRATVRLLAVLPLVGVALGELIGARPVHVLLGTTTGRLSGLTGVALALLAHVWTRRLIARVAPP